MPARVIQCTSNESTCHSIQLDHCYTAPKQNGASEPIITDPSPWDHFLSPGIQNMCEPCIELPDECAPQSQDVTMAPLHCEQPHVLDCPPYTPLSPTKPIFECVKPDLQPICSTPQHEVFTISPKSLSPIAHHFPSSVIAPEPIKPSTQGVVLDNCDSSLADSSTTLVNSGVPDTPIYDLLNQVLIKIHVRLPLSWLPILRGGGIHVGLMASQEVFIVQRSVFVSPNGEVSITVHGFPLPRNHELWRKITIILLSVSTVDKFTDNIINIVDSLRGMELCCGVEDYENLWKGVPDSIIDERNFLEHRYSRTCRDKNCFWLVRGFRVKRCVSCNILQSVLRQRNRTKLKQSPSTPSDRKQHSNLDTPQRTRRLKKNSRLIKNLKLQNIRLRERINHLLTKEGVDLNLDLSGDLSSVLNSAAARSKLTAFQKMFISQQIKASNVHKACGMRWHPLMIRLAMSIQMCSASAYEELSGILKLPSRRQLFNYSHAIAATGRSFQNTSGSITFFESDHLIDNFNDDCDRAILCASSECDES